jgi:light-regulated signal transduction histidine kinase (bacteriophytochrome)
VIPGTSRDITARTQADAARYALNADLEHRVRDRTVQLNALNHDLERFKAAGSHDLQAPRRRIDSVIDALRDDSAERLAAEACRASATWRRLRRACTSSLTRSWP